MNKINESENKASNNSQAFNDKIAMFNMNQQKSQFNQLSSKKVSKPSINKTLTEPKKEKNNIVKNENENNKKEEKPKEVKNVLNIINQINNKNNLTENKNDKEEKKPIENSNFKASLSVFSKPKLENKESEKEKDKDKKDNNNQTKNEEKEKEKEKKCNDNHKKKESKEKDKDIEKKSDDNIIKKIEKNINENDKVEIDKKNENQKEEKNKFKNKINIFNQDKEKEKNKEIPKEKENKSDIKEESNTNVRRMRSATIQERLKQMNIDQKKPKDNLNINKIMKEKKILPIIEEKPEPKEEIEDNQNNKLHNSIHHRATVFSKRSNTTGENKILPPIQEKIIVGEGIQKKIQSLQSHKQTNNKKEKEGLIKKNKPKKNFEFSMIEQLKSIYQPKTKETKTESISNKPMKINNENNVNKNETNKINNEREIIKKENIENKIVNNKEEVKNVNIKEEKSDNNINNNIPKKLDLGKIFKGLNLENFSSMVKESKREEIIQFAQQQKEESLRKTKEPDNDSGDDADASDEEKEKEEEIDKNQGEEEENYQFEKIDNLEHEKEEINKENENLEKNQVKKEGLMSKLKNKLANLNIFKSDKAQKSEQTLKIKEEKFLEQRNTYSNNDLERPSDINSYENQRKMRKTMPFANKIHNSSSSVDDDTLLQFKMVSQNEKSKNDTFCESFFWASFSKDNCKIMENSHDNQAECNHFICGILPAIQPEIIYKYPKEDSKGLEINNLAASICFPNGIKLCYEEKEDNIKAVKNYRSFFTNQLGDRFFVVTYHFFLKKENNEFESEQNITPIQYELYKYRDELRTILSNEPDEDIFEKLNIFGNFRKRQYIYVPHCLCLISKYPYIEQMEKCLESIVKSINDEKLNIEELNNYISYIVRSIPAPPNHCKILFPLAYNYKLIEIQPPYFKDINQFGDNPLVLLSHLSEKNILILFKLLVFEQKVIIVGKDNDLVSRIMLNFVTLLYPFEWIHTYIPIMSEKMLKFLQAFLPFFNGMNLTLLKKAKPILAQASKGVFIFNIDDQTIEINSNYKINSKPTKISSYLKRHIPNFPKNLEQLILKELKSMKLSLEKSKDEQDRLIINLHLKNLFMQIFTEILYDYKKYSYIIDDYPVFNSFLLIKDKEKKGSNFYKEFTSTQLFQMFIQNSLFHPDDKKTYFEERLSDFEEIKKAGATLAFNLEKLFQKFKDDYTKFFEIKKKYVIKPFFMKEFQIFEEKNFSKNKKIKLSDVVKFLVKQYDRPIYTNVNSHGVLFENKRVFDRSIELTNDDDPEEYPIFYIPKQKNENENENEKVESQTSSNKPGSKLKRIKSIKMGIISKEEDIKKNNIKISQALPNKEYELSEDEIDEIKDNIRETMTRVYRSDVSRIEEDKKMIIDSLKTQFGRDYFIKILSNGYKQDYLVKNLVNECYYFFSDVIFNTLLDILKLEENDDNIICAVKLLKSCQYIGTTKNKKEFLVTHNIVNILSDELYSRLEGYSLFNKQRFWELWIEDDMTESEINLQRLLNDESSYVDNESEEYLSYIKHVYSLIDKLTSIMMKMKISNNSIYSNIYELSKEYIIDEEKMKQLRDEAFGQLQIYKAYSNK